MPSIELMACVKQGYQRFEPLADFRTFPATIKADRHRAGLRAAPFHLIWEKPLANKPVDLPVVQWVTCEFIINLEIARLLGTEVPPTPPDGGDRINSDP
jgi:hypothetical protein